MERISTFKYLGVLIDSKLSFNENADTVYNKKIKKKITAVTARPPDA